MLDRFSDNARKMMIGARLAALRHRSPAIDTEHLLLGMLEVETGHAFGMLVDAGVAVDELRRALESTMLPGTDHGTQPRDQLPFTPASKLVLEGAVRVAADAGDRHIGSNHLLLAIVHHGDNDAARVLAALGVDPEQLQRSMTQTLPQKQHSRVDALLISNSTMHGGGYLAHCKAEIEAFLGQKRRVLFVPFALADHDGYEAKAREAFTAIGHELESVHHHKDKVAAVDAADAVFVGGGNTFRLLAALDHYGLLDAIRRRALAGMPYMGSSAGTNVATPSIRTTNDMPIVQPPSFTALQLVPFQINPHYLDPDPGSKHMGETREERIRQFHEEHQVPVLGLREGCMLRVRGLHLELRGTTAARLFRRGEEPVEFSPPCDLSFLMED